MLALYKLMEDVLDLKLQARFFQDEGGGEERVEWEVGVS